MVSGVGVSKIDILESESVSAGLPSQKDFRWSRRKTKFEELEQNICGFNT